MKPDTITALISGINDFPALPAIVTRVMQVTSNIESSAQDLMEAMKPDPSLTVKVLKIANSAFYGRTRKTTSLEQALMVLGFNEIRNMVMATAVFNTFNKLGKIEHFDIDMFWKHSFICGLAAKLMAQELNLAANEMFINGLIHDIGKLAICMVLPRQFSAVAKMSGPFEQKTFQAEQQILGITHDEIGGRLLQRWLFPEEIVTAVKFHHRPDRADTFKRLPFVIHLADRLAHMEAINADQDEFSSTLVEMAKSHGIEWSPTTVEKYKNRLDSQKDAHAGVIKLLLS